MSDQVSIPALLFDPRVLATLFLHRKDTPPPQLPQGVPASSISNPYLRVVAEVYWEQLGRWPTEQELEAWKTVALNPGAHASIARLNGIPLKKGQFLPPDTWREYVREEVARGAPAEIAQRQAEWAKWEQEQQMQNELRRLGNEIVKSIVGVFGPRQQEPLETLAMKEFKERQKQREFENMLSLSQLFGIGSVYGLPLQYWLGQSQQRVNVPGALETLARLRAYHKASY